VLISFLEVGATNEQMFANHSSKLAISFRGFTLKWTDINRIATLCINLTVNPPICTPLYILYLVWRHFCWKFVWFLFIQVKCYGTDVATNNFVWSLSHCMTYNKSHSLNNVLSLTSVNIILSASIQLLLCFFCNLDNAFSYGEWNANKCIQ
jgi:hypothetical protein